MQAENWAVKALENYCDLIAEYDRKNQRFFIYHDISKPEDTGRWLPVEDVRARFQGAYATDMFGARVNEADMREWFSQGQERFDFQLRFRNYGPEQKWYSIHMECVSDELLLLTGKDMYDERYYDALTGAYNRNYYELHIKDTPASGGVAVIDLDDFKLYNDTYGHNVGDMALSKVTEVIMGAMGRAGTVIRYGGDEFLLLMPSVSDDYFEATLELIRSRTKALRIPGCEELQVSVSIGGVSAGLETTAAAVLRADRLMYRAKMRKNTVVTDRTVMEERQLPEKKAPRMGQVLVVDDSAMNRAILTEMLGSDFRILEASNGKECMEKLKQYGTGISLVLLDMIMPVMDGFTVLAEMNKAHYIEDIPVVTISVDASDNNTRMAYEMGVSDYISRPFDAEVVYHRVVNTIKLYAKQRRLISIISQQSQEREKDNRVMIGILSGVVGYHNKESAAHMLHIRRVTTLLLEQLTRKTSRYGLSPQDIELIGMASTLHDIGKLGISDAILNKPGPLNEEEKAIMRTHTVIGESILKGMEMYEKEPLLKTAARICRWHHERADGGGYPDGLAGDEIPISVHVVGLADVYDALVSDRAYKSAYPAQRAMEMIRSGACGAFDSLLVECLADIQDVLTADVYRETLER